MQVQGDATKENAENAKINTSLHSLRLRGLDHMERIEHKDYDLSDFSFEFSGLFAFFAANLRGHTRNPMCV